MNAMPRKPSSVTPDEILTSEFNYIAHTAFQANEDWARATSFYLATFGSFIAALVSAQLDLAPEQAYWLDWGFVGLFATLALMGLVTVLQLTRLRACRFGIEHCSFLGKFPVFHAQLMVKCFALSLELRKRFKHREGWPGRLRRMS